MKGLFHRLAEQAVGDGSAIVPVGAARFEPPAELIESEVPGPEGRATWSTTTRNRGRGALSAPSTAVPEDGGPSRPARVGADFSGRRSESPPEGPRQDESAYRTAPSADPLENPGGESVGSPAAAVVPGQAWREGTSPGMPETAPSVGPQPAVAPAATQRDGMAESRGTDEPWAAPRRQPPEEFDGAPGDGADARWLLRQQSDGTVPTVPAPPERHPGPDGDAGYDERPAAPSGDTNPSSAGGAEATPPAPSRAFPVSAHGKADSPRTEPVAAVSRPEFEASASSRQQSPVHAHSSPDVGGGDAPPRPLSRPVGAARDHDVGADQGEPGVRLDSPPSDVAPPSATPPQGEEVSEGTERPAEPTAERPPSKESAVPAGEGAIGRISMEPAPPPSPQRPETEGAVPARRDSPGRFSVAPGPSSSASPQRPEIGGVGPPRGDASGGALAAPARPPSPQGQEPEGTVPVRDDRSERVSAQAARPPSPQRPEPQAILPAREDTIKAVSPAPAEPPSPQPPETTSRPVGRGDSRREGAVSHHGPRHGPRPAPDGEPARSQSVGDRSAQSSADDGPAKEFALPERSGADARLEPGATAAGRGAAPPGSTSSARRSDVGEGAGDPPRETASTGPHRADSTRSRTIANGPPSATLRSADSGEDPLGRGSSQRIDPTVRRETEPARRDPAGRGAAERGVVTSPPAQSPEAAGRPAGGMPRTARSPRPEIDERPAPPDGEEGPSAAAQTARPPGTMPEAARRDRSGDGNKRTWVASPDTAGTAHRPRSPAEPIGGRLAERRGMDERSGPVRVSIDTITIDAQAPPAGTRRSPRAAPKVSLEAYARRHKAPDR